MLCHRHRTWHQPSHNIQTQGRPVAVLSIDVEHQTGVHNYLFIRPSFDGRIMVWRCPSVRLSIHSVVHNPCGQDIARTMWPRMLKLSVYTLYGKRKKPIYVEGQRPNFKFTGPLQRILAPGSLWAGYRYIGRTIQSKLLKFSMYTSYGKRKKPICYQGQMSRSLGLYKWFWDLDPCG